MNFSTTTTTTSKTAKPPCGPNLIFTPSQITISSEAQAVTMAPPTEEQDRPYKKQRLFGSFGESVTLHVGSGKDEVVLYAHEKLLRNASPFFDAACKKEWMKPDERVIKMPEDDPMAIRVLLHWIYHDEICLPPSPRGLVFDCTEDWIGFLLKVFNLADKYLMTRMKNDVMDTAVQLWENKLSPLILIGDETVNHIYANTSEESPFRKFMVEILKGSLEEYEFYDVFDKQNFCSAVLKDMIERFCNGNEGRNLKRNCLLYHTHADKDEKAFKQCKTLKAYMTSEED